MTTYTYGRESLRLERLRLVRASDDALMQDLRYTYDPVGNIVQIRDGAQPEVYFANDVVVAEQLFEYSALYRLTTASGREHASLGQPTDADFAFGPQPHPDDPAALRRYEERYVWDAVGNILELRHAASGGSFTRQHIYAAGGNRLLASSAPGESVAPFSHSYPYDAHGNMTAMPHLAAIAWDHADRMQHCDLGGGGDVWFVYDAGGERVRKVQVNASGSTVRERIYLGAYEVYRERAASSTTPTAERQTLHVADDTGRLCLVETLTVDDGEIVEAPVSIQRYQHGNHLGSAVLELDAEAAVISYEEFHPFGTTSYAANDAGIEVSAKRYRYIDRERDEETGLYHLGARYYATWLARWTAADPSGLGDGPNRYAYAGNRPIGSRDATGNAEEPLMVGVMLVTTGRGSGGRGPQVYEGDADFIGTRAHAAKRAERGGDLLATKGADPGALFRRGVRAHARGKAAIAKLSDDRVAQSKASAPIVAGIAIGVLTGGLAAAGAAAVGLGAVAAGVVSGAIGGAAGNASTATLQGRSGSEIAEEAAVGAATGALLGGVFAKLGSFSSFAKAERAVSEVAGDGVSAAAAARSPADFLAEAERRVAATKAGYPGAGDVFGMADDAARGQTAGRVAELRGAISEAQQGRVTMGVGLAEDASGAQRLLVGTSEPRGYLRPGVTLANGETLAPGIGHAEQDIVNYALQNGLRLLEVGATRPICPTCAAAIESAGAKAVTPLKKVK